MLVGTKCDLIKNNEGNVDAGEIQARCDHVVQSLQAEEEKDVNQLKYCREQLCGSRQSATGKGCRGSAD
jgi:hypothetical protein